MTVAGRPAMQSVTRQTLTDVCALLGLDPARVVRISLFPDRVVVDLVDASRGGLGWTEVLQVRL